MPLKPVARDGDVTATPGTLPFTGAASGAWTAGPVKTSGYAFLTIEGVPIIHEATCTFSFSGLSSGSTAVTGTSSVTLTAASTMLQNGTTFVLRDGDSAQDQFGNTLGAHAANHVRSE